jgi:hypothetical protein
MQNLAFIKGKLQRPRAWTECMPSNTYNVRRRTKRNLITVGLILLSAGSALANAHYVDLNSTNPTPPYTDWATAATNLQDAVDAAVTGDEIVVTNGTYAAGGRTTVGDTTPNRVVVDKPIIIRSVNGPQVTLIDGGQSNRCVYLASNASLSGLTLTNGLAWHGAGVWCGSATAVVSNCVVSGNAAPEGLIARTLDEPSGGGVYGGTIDHCILGDNRVLTYETEFGPIGGGGGACNAILNYCTLTSNLAGGGGGAAGCTLNNCTLVANSGERGAGGVSGCTLNNCILSSNSGGFGGGALGGTLNNCLVIGNSAAYGGGAWKSTLNNCTVADNSASIWGGGVTGGTLNNCIVYFNTAGGSESNFADVHRYPPPGVGTGDPDPVTLNYCCTTPLPASGVGNLTNAPLFVDTNGWANLRLQFNSTCVNAGNNAYVVGNTDLDGNPRVNRGVVDIGAYEFQAAVRYVNLSSANPTPPYTNWPTAATNIQDAVDVAAAGDEIVVTNGIYATGGRALTGDSTTNRAAVDKPLSIRSINGPHFTIIDGGWSSRCVYLTGGANLSGFTLTHGSAGFGGGAWCAFATAVVSNCRVVGNSASLPAGFFVVAGGGVYGGTVNDCVISNNFALGGEVGGLGQERYIGSTGGGAAEATLNNCTLTGNSASVGWGRTSIGVPYDGGGAYGCTLNNCTLVGNSAIRSGGGTSGCSLNNCTLSGNSANYGGGAHGGILITCMLLTNEASLGAGGGAFECVLCNCTLAGNRAIGDQYVSGFGGGASDCTLNNCTLTANVATGPVPAGHSYHGGSGASGSTLNNCILYLNGQSNDSGGTNLDNYDSSCVLSYCCAENLPTQGVGNIAVDPMFVDQSSWNLRLQPNSPCINAGNNTYAVGVTDLDGNPRIAGGTLDIGAYEFQAPASIISYAWLQQFGLPTDGSADHADPDHDGMDNWQEWRCGTDPANALSVLRLVAVMPTGTNVMVAWQSIAGVTYFLERSTSLAGLPSFTLLATNLLGQAGTTTYADTNAGGGGPWFYRVGVRK